VTALWTILGIAAYLAIYHTLGWHLARRDLPNAWRRARTDWHSGEVIKESVRAQTMCMILLWPVLAPARSLWGRFAQTVDATDPRERERKLAEREKRIAQLERQLGIGGSERL
jgi:hypothetical protein